MATPTTVEQAVKKASALLADEEYQSLSDWTNIARIQLAQAQIIGLRKRGLSNYMIAAGIGVEEKSVRMWGRAQHSPTLEHAIALSTFYVKTMAVG